jgi:alpha-ketoglutarate-dependent sulfate ester dioxygenase
MTVEATAITPKIEVKPVTPRIGAVISDADLADDLSAETVSEIRNALLRHRVVFFQDQHLDASGQLKFARRLGTLTRAHPTLPGSPDSAALYDLDSHTGSAANHWHTDVTFVQQPPNFSMLRAIVIPDIGGDTLWANTVAAYEDLRPTIRSLADELRAIHTNGNDYGRADVISTSGNLRPERLDHIQAFVSKVFETEHPVVRIHSETGERALLLGGFAQRLAAHSSAESVDILRTLQSYVTRPENTVRWQWREGDVAIWDNRATQHYAIYDYGDRHRSVQRVTTAGVTPIGIDGRESVAIKGDASDYYSVD